MNALWLTETAGDSRAEARNLEQVQYQAAMDAMHQRLERLESKSLRTILDRLAEVRRDVVERLSSLPQTTAADGSETWQATQVKLYRDELDEMLRRFGQRYAAELTGILREGADLAAGQADALTELARVAGVPRAMISFGPLGLLEDQVAAAMMFAADSIKGVEAALASTIQREIQMVVFGGQSRWDAVRNIRAALVTTPGEKLGSVTQRAITLERTALITVFSLASDHFIREAADELPGLQAEWVTILDGRADSICRGLSGKRVKPGEAFPGGYLRPPAHARCRCRVIAWLPTWESDPNPVGAPNRRGVPLVPA